MDNNFHRFFRTLTFEYSLLTLPVLFSLTCCSDLLNYLGVSSVLLVLIFGFFSHINATIEKKSYSQDRRKRSDDPVIAKVR